MPVGVRCAGSSGTGSKTVSSTPRTVAPGSTAVSLAWTWVMCRPSRSMQSIGSICCQNRWEGSRFTPMFVGSTFSRNCSKVGGEKTRLRGCISKAICTSCCRASASISFQNGTATDHWYSRMSRSMPFQGLTIHAGYRAPSSVPGVPDMATTSGTPSVPASSMVRRRSWAWGLPSAGSEGFGERVILQAGGVGAVGESHGCGPFAMGCRGEVRSADRDRASALGGGLCDRAEHPHLTVAVGEARALRERAIGDAGDLLQEGGGLVGELFDLVQPYAAEGHRGAVAEVGELRIDQHLAQPTQALGRGGVCDLDLARAVQRPAGGATGAQHGQRLVVGQAVGHSGDGEGAGRTGG